MVYVEGSLPAGANNSKAMYLKIEEALLADGNYALVETVTIGARTHKVWQNTADGFSGAGFYLDIAYQESGNTPVYFMPFEQWDAVGKAAIRAVYSVAGTTAQDPATGSRYGAAGHTLESTNHPLRAGQSQAAQISVSAGAFAYYLHVNEHRLVAHSQADGGTVYAGAYSRSAETQEIADKGIGWSHFPVIAFNAATGSSSPSTASNACALTRYFPASATAMRYSSECATFMDYLLSVPPVETQKGSVKLSPIMVRYIASPSLYVGQYGELYEFWHVSCTATVQRGDRVQAGPLLDEYTILRGSGSSGWVVRAS